ncbi:MAG: tRNA (N(6)-L-threonylcarbamoyladenosine(37)-C(2))-methylthiotransferase MtaB [Bacillota bacterium]|nr:tRNA (N(6)-L-threonylcarbamoyladenosine(37)-C(2))-methylthiotransferase MtaB [Bacillota bacterium]
MNFKIITLGCKVNQYESEAMREMLKKSGFSCANDEETTDIIIVNSCTVTKTSDSKVTKLLRRERRENTHCVLILTGCMPQAFPDDHELFEDADIVLGNALRSELVSVIESFLTNHQKQILIHKHENKANFEKMSVSKFDDRTRAFVKIEDGCNRFCSYCIIPYARGRVRSKPLEDLHEEISKLSQNGYKEIVLVGINLSAYGQDIGCDLFDAIKIANDTKGIERVRLGSLEPERLDITTIEKLSKLEKLCPQFHLSLQSGCDETLKRMNRHYNTDEYRKIVENLRSFFKNASVTTDIMVGFAGETDEEFEKSINFVKEIGFSKMHVFPYSRRKGTVAYDAPNQVNEAIKTKRTNIMLKAAEESRVEFLEGQIGKTELVLFEKANQDGYFEGYTENYTPVFVKTNENLSGFILPVKNISCNKDSCFGELC